MTTPTTSIYVRPGSTSSTWSFANASVKTASDVLPIASVSFLLDSSLGQQMARGSFQYSVNGGGWTSYVLPTDSEGAWVPANAVWRFVDTDGAELLDAGNFTMHWKLADGSVASSNAAVMADDQPVGLVDASGSMLSTLHGGEAVTVLQAIDNGDPLGGRWVIEGQSQPGLFGLSTDASTGVTRLVLANAAAMPAVEGTASVTLHYYDHYQLDASGNPIPGTGVSGTMGFNVVAGSSVALPAFGQEMQVGPASGAYAAPVVASLSNGAYAVAWQGNDGVVWAQLRGAGGIAVDSPFAISPGDANVESHPAVAALADGGFVVAYTVQDANYNSHVAYRIVHGSGIIDAEVNASGSAGSASAPAVTGRADGSFELAWQQGGVLMVEHVDASGAGHPASALAVNGSVASPDIAVLGNGSLVAVWGQIDDGNVYAQVGGTVIQVTTDGAAANNLTAAPLAHVTALAGGGFVVAWDSYSNDPRGFSMSDIFFQRYDNAGNPLGAIEQANIDSGGGRFDAEVAATADGGFVIEWQGADADGSGIFGRRYAADGSAIDAHEFQVNENAQGDQSSPALAVTAGGGFASTWIDSFNGSNTIEMRMFAGGGDAGTGSGSSGGSGGAVTPLPGTGSGSTGSGGTDSGTTGSGSGSGGTVGTTPTPQKVVGTSGDNVFASGNGMHAIDGGAGVDTVTYPGAHADFTVTAGDAGLTVTGGSGAVQDTLVNVERVQFSDLSLAFDVNGTAGEAYRLYQAAFDRTPDINGLGYWINALDSGMALAQVSGFFIDSKEFVDLYGAQLSDSQFVDALYHNVLHRAGETAGVEFWMQTLSYGVSRATVLTDFSESAENQAQLIGTIQHGMEFVPFA